MIYDHIEMDRESNNRTIGVLIVSILVAALIVRIIYVMFDGIRVLVEEIFDDDDDIPFNRSSYYILNAVLVTCLCLFCLILIYEGYIVSYLNKVPVETPDDSQLAVVTAMNVNGHTPGSTHDGGEHI